MTQRTPSSAAAEAAIPFWRNVKTIGILAQLAFVIAIVAAIGVLVNNVVTALAAANLPADFSFLRNPAGIPIAERPIPYVVSDTYARALLIGFLNTLKVALVGVVLATVIGVLFGVMRLSANWLIRTIATVYIELLRNIPLAVQIVFWFAAILLPFPPRISDPVALPGGLLLSNVGLAFPAFYPTFRFGFWVPWLVAALVLAIVTGVWRKRRLDKRDEVGAIWPYWVSSFVLVAAAGLALSYMTRTVPAGLEFNYQASSGRGTTTMVSDGESRPAAFVPVRVGITEGRLTTTSQNLVESRQVVHGTFRFPLINENEAGTIVVDFADPDDAAARGLRLHFTNYPSVGTVYADLNANDEFDEGEEVDPATGRGYGGVSIIMDVTDFARVLVSDRDGQLRLPAFAAPVTEEAEAQESAVPAAGGRFSAFGQAATATTAAATLEATSELLPMGSLVFSRAYVPVSNYEGGMRFTVNYLALLLALVIYTSAFIAEIV
ncbi:MAG: ABC transporter permease subunit, partial [Trueperaceae bacterium]